MLDNTIIDNIRKFITEEDLYETFKMNKCIDKWNSLCSSLDWLEYGVEIYNELKIKNESWTHRGSYKEILDLIMSSAIIVENSNNIINIFGMELEIFEGFATHKEKNSSYLKYFYSSSNPNDLEIFKKIRAIFGAHNIDIYGANNKKYYASWPYNEATKTRSDWECIIYKQGPENGELIFYGFDVEELKGYVKHIFDLMRSVI